MPILIERNGQQYTIQVAQNEPNTEGAWLGVYLQDAAQGQPGVRIVSVYPSGPAARGGLQPGDVIQQLNGQPVQSTPDLIASIESMEPQSRAEFVIERGGQPLQIPIVLGDRETFVSYQQWGSDQGGQDQGQGGQFYGGGYEDEDGNVPPHAMQLEHDRRMAEQHQRIETALQKLQEEVRQLRETLNQGR
ncbi:MAG: S1C family serine protease [Pirellulaceae bacterium]